jgi:hypothetical protein
VERAEDDEELADEPDVPGNPAFARPNSTISAANFGIVLMTPP